MLTAGDRSRGSLTLHSAKPQKPELKARQDLLLNRHYKPVSQICKMRVPPDTI